MIKRIAIHSVPRSGSTWLGSIFDSHPNVTYKFQPLFSYRFKSYLSEKSTKGEIESFFSEIAKVDDEFLDQKLSKERGILPKFYKENSKAIVYKEVRYHHIISNLLRQDSELKVIGIIRNPLSVLHSWVNAPREFRHGWKFEDEWRFAPQKNQAKLEEFYGYEKWKEVAYLFHSLHAEWPSQFYLINYLSLLRKPLEEVSSVFDFCQLEVKQQTLDFLEVSTSTSVDDPYAVFRSKQRDDKWKGNISEQVADLIERELKGTCLEIYL